LFAKLFFERETNVTSTLVYNNELAAPVWWAENSL